ncbi:TOM1-like protein 1 [Loxodonta africana]|uniref:TOM1-like protein 1 n=1 Tax=Loxodonta africana TaxID=9785 RepID=UPI0030CCBB5F
MTDNVNPSCHPQLNFVASGNTETPLLPQRTSQNLASSHTYDNSIPATSSNQRLPSLPGNHPAMTKNDLQPSNYYEVMEFDPLAPDVTAETVYEEIDVNHLRRVQSYTDC